MMLFSVIEFFSIKVIQFITIMFRISEFNRGNMKLILVSFLIVSAKGSLFGRDNGCNIMTPTNPDCCFMTNPDDPRAQNIPGTLPLTKSPYIMNLVTANGKSLNTLDKATYDGKQIWTLTPLIDDPNDSSKQVPGGPVKVEVI